MSESLLFLSHAAVDVELAAFLEQQLRIGNKDLEVFRTTRVGAIPSGRPWLQHIHEHLQRATHYMVLLTPWSQQRPWIAFETGAAWMSGRRLVPVTAGSLGKGDVVEPLRSLQILNLELPEEAAQAFRDCSSELGNALEFASTVMSIAQRNRPATFDLSEWEHVKIGDEVYAWDGPLDDFQVGRDLAIQNDFVTAFAGATGKQLTTAMMTTPDRVVRYTGSGWKLVWKLDIPRKRRHRLVNEQGKALLLK